MAAQLQIGDLIQDPEALVHELRHFFSSRDVAFGQPECLLPFTRRVAEDQAFRDEMTSMARFVLYAAQDGTPRIDLLKTLVLAIGGDAAVPDADSPGEPLQAMRSFVGQCQRVALPTELAVEALPEAGPSHPLTISPEPALPAAHSPGTPEQTAVLNTRAAKQIATADPACAIDADLCTAESKQTVLPEPPDPSETTSAQRPNKRLSQALLRNHASFKQKEEEEERPSEPDLEPPFDYAPETPRNTVPGRARTWLQKAYWVPGVAVLLAVLLSFGYMRWHPVASASPHSTPSPAPTQSAFQPIPATDPALTVPTASAAPAPQAGSPLETPPSPPKHAPVAARTIPRAPFAQHKGGSQPAIAALRYPPQAFTGPGLDADLRRENLVVTRHGPYSEVHEGVFLATSSNMAAHLVYAPTPAYPRLASFTRVQGQVILQVVVAQSGAVAVTRVLGGPRLLRGAAERAIRQWRYKPYVVDGKTTDVATIVTVTFKLPH